MQHTDEDPWGPVELRIYPGSDGAFDLYEDAGDGYGYGYGYEEGEHSTVPIRWDDAAQVLTVSPRDGSFPAMPPNRDLHPVVVTHRTGLGTAVAAMTPAISYHGEQEQWRP